MKDGRISLRINSKVKKKMAALKISPQVILDNFINRHKELKAVNDKDKITRKHLSIIKNVSK